MKKINIYFSWTELPTYGYFLLKFLNYKIANNKLINFRVISTKTNLNKNYIENNRFYKKIIWIDKNKKYTWKNIGLEIPNIFFQSGWHVKSFKYLGKLVKKENINNKIVVLADNSLQKNNFKQYIGGIFFKFFFKKKFDYAFVPGISGKKLMINFGFTKKNIYTGLYSSLTDYYKNKTLPEKRKKQFLFAGQLISRKNVLSLIKAFKLANLKNNDWKLIMVGNGNLKIKKKLLGANIHLIKNLQPEQLAKLYNESLFFILPSLRDHWPLVVHEASLCGCNLLLSNNIGNIPDLSNKKNSIIFDPKSIFSIQQAIEKGMKLKGKKLLQGNKESEKLAKKFNYNLFSSKCLDIINDYKQRMIFSKN